MNRIRPSRLPVDESPRSSPLDHPQASVPRVIRRPLAPLHAGAHRRREAHCDVGCEVEGGGGGLHEAGHAVLPEDAWSCAPTAPDEALSKIF